MHRWGREDGALIALHGFTGSGLDFEALVPQLGVGVVAPDLPGHMGVPPAAMSEAVAQLRPLVSGRVLLGYSMGGRTALQLACVEPVQALVLIGATPGIADPAQRALRQAADAALADRIEAIGLTAFLEEWSRKPIIATQDRIAPRWRRPMVERKHQHLAAGLAGSLRGMGAGTMVPVWDRLPQVPTLLIVGEQDQKFTAIAEAMAARMARAEVVRIDGAGHCAHLESPEQVGAAVDGFLRRLG